MVIQRNWKTTSNSTENAQHTSSSEDSNSSWQTLSNSANSGQNKNGVAVHPANPISSATASAAQVPVTKISTSNPQMAENVHKALKHRYNGRSHIHQTNADAAILSMELMRMNIQEAFDKEIDSIIKKYVDSFFKPTVKNVKENLGENSVSIDCLQKMSCSLLENSKLQYYSPPKVSIKTEPGTTILSTALTQTLTPVKVETLKRKEAPTSVEVDQEPIKKIQTNIQLKSMGRTKQVFWNVSHLNTDTLFILDYKANRALGFAENSKERLASKHPELIRYLPDAADKEWLYQQKAISLINKNSRFLLLVHAEVCKISQTEEYRHKTKVSELEGFKVPEFILRKMKIFFTELSLRSQSFLVNNTPPSSLKNSVTATISSHPYQNQMQHHTTTGQTTISLTNTITTSSAGLSSISSGSGVANIGGGGLIIKPRSSLSSSHATLSALLSSSTESVSSSSVIPHDVTGSVITSGGGNELITNTVYNVTTTVIGLSAGSSSVQKD